MFHAVKGLPEDSGRSGVRICYCRTDRAGDSDGEGVRSVRGSGGLSPLPAARIPKVVIPFAGSAYPGRGNRENSMNIGRMTFNIRII